MSWLEVVAVIVTAFGVWLLAVRSLWCWPVAIAGVVLYAWIFQQARLYSDMLLQGFFLAANIYGWIQWTGGADDGAGIRVAKPGLPEMGAGIGIAIAGALALGYPMARYTDAAAPWIDSALSSFSILAQVWAARRFIANWFLWITLDVAYIALFTYKHLYLTSGLYVMMMILCFYGLYDWRKAERA